MKKRIISLVLALVMVVMALVSCGQASIVSRDLNDYLEVEFDKAAFIEALGKLEIEDGSFTDDDAKRDIIAAETIYSAIAAAVVSEGNKKTDGVVGANDVLYYNYYIEDAEGKKYSFASMKPSSVTASATKANHTVQLGAVSEDDDNYAFTSALKAALIASNVADIKEYIYSVNSTTNTTVTVEDNKPVTVVVSYTRAHTDAEGGTVTEKATYELLTLDKSSSDPLVQKLLSEGATLKIGNSATFSKTVTKEDGSTETVKETEFVVGDYTYSAFKVEWVIESGAEMFSFKYTPDEKFELAPESLPSSATKVDLKDKELTYHVYPVYYYEVPETSAESIVRYVLGKDIKVDSFDVFENESYKNGEKTVKSIIEELAKIYTVAASKTEKFDKTSSDNDIKLLGLIQAEEFATDSTTEVIAKLAHLIGLKKVSESTTEAEETVNTALAWIESNMAEDEDAKDLLALKKAYDDLKSAETPDNTKIETAKSKFNTAALAFYDAEKTKAYSEALEAAKASKIKLLVEASYTVAATDTTPEEVKVLGDAIVKEKIADVRYSLEIEYNEYITEAVGKAVYKLIDKSVKIAEYPEDILEEFYNHIYESYEYNFYKGNSATKDKDGKTQSNYKAHGNLETFLKSADGTGKEDWKAAITEEAKSHVAPIIKLYVVAKAFADDANRDTISFIEADILAGRYDADYEDDATEAEKDEANKNAEESKKNARENAKKMLVTDEVFDDYKKSLGSAYSYYEEQYGERNLRAALQSNRLFYYFLSNKLVADEYEDASSNVKTLAEKNAEGKWVVKFNNSMIGYVLVEDADDHTGHDHD